MVTMKTILILEPHDAMRGVLVDVVRHLGHETVTEAVGNWSVPRVHAILVDPAHTVSRETARVLRSLFPELPIVCVGVFGPGSDVIDVLAPVACLPKPFELAQLEGALTTAVASRREPSRVLACAGTARGPRTPTGRAR
jgi:CheY-like chemotaxis protein